MSNILIAAHSYTYGIWHYFWRFVRFGLILMIHLAIDCVEYIDLSKVHWKGVCHYILTVLKLKSEYFGVNRSIPWPLGSLGHQQPRYWLCRMNRSIPYTWEWISTPEPSQCLEIVKENGNIFRISSSYIKHDKDSLHNKWQKRINVKGLKAMFNTKQGNLRLCFDFKQT